MTWGDVPHPVGSSGLQTDRWLRRVQLESRRAPAVLAHQVDQSDAMMCGVRRTDTPPGHRAQPSISSRSAFIACYTASGAAALVYEVTWTRLFALHLGHTVGAASTVLAAFMGGL